jgi:hypothetical protein
VPETPARERYQFVDGHGRRTHFSTKVRAKLERDEAKALFAQEGKLAAGMDGQYRLDTAQAIGLLPAGWTLTRGAQFVADHVRRTTQVLPNPEIHALLRTLAAFSEKGKNLRLIIETGGVVDVH